MKKHSTLITSAMVRFPARIFDSLLETAVMLRYTQSKCTWCSIYSKPKSVHGQEHDTVILSITSLPELLKKYVKT
jgi:hypothetical protein